MIPLYSQKAEVQASITKPGISKPTQKELILSLKNCEPGAAQIFHETYSNTLYGIIRRHVSDEVEAQGVLKLTFEKALGTIDEYHPDKLSLFSWMTRIAHQVASDQSREQHPTQTEIAEPKIQGQATLRVVYTAGNALGNEAAAKFADAIEPKYRMILNLIYLQGFSPEEIASRLSLPVEEVKKRLATAVRQLRTACISV